MLKLVAELDDISTALFHVIFVGVVTHFHNGGCLGRLLEHFLKVYLLYEQLVGFVWLQVVLRLNHQEFLS